MIKGEINIGKSLKVKKREGSGEISGPSRESSDAATPVLGGKLKNSESSPETTQESPMKI